MADHRVEIVADATDILLVPPNPVIDARDGIGAVPGKIAVAMASASAEATACPFAVGRANPTRRDTLLRVSNTDSSMQTHLASSV